MGSFGDSMISGFEVWVGRYAALLLRSDEGIVFVNSGSREEPSGMARRLIGRAAHFRTEADVLRVRASLAAEPVVREQYLALAERWSMFAAGLEAEALTASL
jgi:hypothetical protein